MPASTQNLYFHFGMRADDDGFIGSPKKITTMVNCSADDLKLLIAKGFVLVFDSGICVVRDWKINNQIKKDRYHETRYLEEKRCLCVDETGVYNKMEPFCIQDGSKVEPEVSQVKASRGKDRKKNTPPLAAATVEQFERFWAVYPKRAGKKEAQKAWNKMKPDSDLVDKILTAVEQQKKSSQWTRDNGQYIPYPATWLNQNRWEDELEMKGDGTHGEHQGFTGKTWGLKSDLD